MDDIFLLIEHKFGFSPIWKTGGQHFIPYKHILQDYIYYNFSMKNI